MSTSTKQQTVFDLTEATLSHIGSKGYSESYVKGFRQIYSRLNKYCEEKNIQQFTTEMGQQFLYECYSIEPGTVIRKFSRQHRAMDMIADFQQFGTVMLKRRLNRSFPKQFVDDAENYLLHIEADYAQPNTVLSHKKSLFKFTDFLDSVGVTSFKAMTLEHANTYIKVVLCNYSKEVARLHMGIMKRFLHYLHITEVIDDDIASKLITIKFSQQYSHLPDTLPEEDIKKILSCVDRESPMGKRDYAILMLATKLGLRGSDIRNLKPGDIDWVKHEIRITQIKTKEPLVLPLPNDVGWALIDYLKNARPTSDATEIFLMVIAPYTQLNNLDNVLIRYMRLAGISYTDLHHHGLHTLRHSLATHMLEKEIPITTIQGVLGHINAETTRRYTSIDVKQLRECALEVPAL